MNTRHLALDYLRKAKARGAALHTLFREASYDDVVREAQEIFELVTKGSLRWIGIEPPKTHDVSAAMKKHVEQFPPFWRQENDWICTISKNLFEERGHAFYGDEGDGTPPAALFTKEEAEQVLAWIRKLLGLYERLLATSA